MKKPIIIAFGNRKGGVAKSSSVAALASYYAKQGFKVLAVDLDTQGSLTITFLKSIPEDTVSNIFDGKRIPIQHVRDNLDLVAADDDLAADEQDLKKPDDRLILSRALAVIKDNYDLILLDCPPSLSWLTINALSACDKLIVPMDIDNKSIKAVNDMAVACYKSATPTKIDGIFFTIYEKKLKVTQMVETLMRDQYGATILETAIRKCSKIKESSMAYTDVITYAPCCNAAKDYQLLGDEILRLIGVEVKEDSKEA